jgi:type II secretory pathway component GspD/PulD (secretin)
MKTRIHLPLIALAAGLIALPSLALETVQSRPAAKPPAEKKLPPGVLGNIQLTQIRLEEVARLLSQIGNANVVVTSKVSDLVVSLYLHDASVDDMVRNVSRAAGAWYRFDSTSKTYVIMSGEEYQKDLTIVRDEKTQVFTLRHHNVVSTANAIKALFGMRVALSTPVEEMPPTSLGSGNRTTAGGRSGSGGSSGSGSGGRAGAGNASQGASNTSGNTGMADQSQALGNQGGSGGGTLGATANYDPTTDIGRMSQDRMAGQTRLNANGQPMLSGSDIQEMAARQGPAILVTYNKLNNLLMVRTGDEQALKEIGKLVSDMDRPPKQVLLEMKILEVTLDDGYRSVFDIGQSGKGTTSGPSGWGATNSTGVTSRNSLGTGLFDVETNANLIWQVMSSNLSFRLQLLANENKLKVLSSPMLVAANNQIARLFIGDERVLTVGASSQSVTGTTGATNTTITVETEKRDVGQTLAILPRINGDRSISLTVDQDSSTVKIGDATIPISTAAGNVIYFPIDTVNTANLQVTAHAKHGMTVAIGGMIKETVTRDDEKVPVLGDVPVLGFFFKRDVRAKVRTKIVLLITPRIIETPEEGDSIATAKTQDFNATTATFPTTKTVPKLTNDWPVAPPTGIDRSNARDGDAAYAGLARSAAAAVLQRNPNKAPPDGLSAVAAGARKSMVLDNGMPAEVSGSWVRDGLYVTALRVSNWSARNATLQAAALPGRWSAIVIENPELGPDGSSEAATWLYAISRLPFEQSLDLP